MHVISICTQKGGVSKTSSTIEIATVLKNKGRRVLVIDLDQQCSLTKNIAADLSGNTIYDVLHANCSIEDAIQQNDLFDVIAGSPSLSRADREFVEDDDNFLLLDVMELVKDNYDYAFVDLGPNRSKLTTMTYIASDYIIPATLCDESSIDGVVVTQKDVQKLVEGRHHDSHAKILGYILAYNEKTTMHAIALENLQELVEEQGGYPFLKTVSKAIRISEVKTLHTAVCKIEKSSKTAREYYAIAEEIIKRVEAK